MRSGAFTGISLFLSRFGLLIRNVAIAATFGATAQTDAFRLAFQTPQWLFLIVSGAAVGNSFSPAFSKLLVTDKPSDAWKLYSVILTALLSAGAVFLVFGSVANPLLCHLLSPGKPAESQAPMVAMTQILLPAEWCLSVGGVLYAALYARQTFSIPGLSGAILALGALFGVLVGAVTGQIQSIAWGIFAGALFGSVILPSIALRRVGVPFRPSLDLNSSGVREVLLELVAESIVFGMPVLLMIALQIFATYFRAGSNTLIEYAGGVALLPIILFGSPLANTMRPALVQFRANHRPDLARTLLDSLIGTSCFLALTFAGIVLALAPQIVAALFDHGAFDHEQVKACSDLLRLFAIGILGWTVQPLLARSLVSAGDLTSAAMVSLASPVLICLWIVGFSGKQTSLGILPISMSAVTLLLAVILFVLVCRSYGGAIAVPVLLSFLKSVVCAAVAGGALFGASLLMGPYLHGSWLIPIVILLLLIGFWISLGVARLLKMKEARFSMAGLE